VTQFTRGTALRSTALPPPWSYLVAASLLLTIGLAAFTAEASASTKVPLPRSRPIARNAVSKKVEAKAEAETDWKKTEAKIKAKIETKTEATRTEAAKTETTRAAQIEKPAGSAPKETAKDAVRTTASLGAPMQIAPVLAPATRQHAALPPPAERKPVVQAAIAATSSTPQADTDTLKSIIQLIRKHQPADATQAETAISDPLAKKLAEWIILRSEDNGASVERYRAFIEANPSWPSQNFLRRRLEAALWDDHRDGATVMSWFADEKPLSAKGRFALAQALLARGDRANAERLVRDAWRNDGMAEETENNALNLFGPLITPGDQKARMDLFAYTTENEAAAMRAAKRLGSGYVALVKARLASVRKAPNAKALLDAVPYELRSDAGYVFAKIQQLRREQKYAEEAQLILGAPRDPARIYNVDEWWIERRLAARNMIDLGEYKTAYLIARDAALPTRDIYKTEQEFTAGWIALRFLRDPATAAEHFARIGVGSTNPTTLARAGYWQGRAAEATGRLQEARVAYTSAAEQSTSYYGQLARAKLGLPQIALRGAPVARGRSVDRLEIVRAVQLLYAVDEREIAVPIFADTGENGDPEALVGLGELASHNDDARGMLLLGKAALNRGLPFDFYAYPVNGIPRFRPVGPEVEQSVIFAIARQESAFNPTDVSSAQAYGLMQVTPDAGRYVCKKYSVGFDLQRMKADPVYNTALGAAELGGLLEDYRGSYVMTFAAYNAGRGSVAKWIERYGDPRDPKVDAVDWVELIPFSETRNYVERVIENLQVYRARFGGGTRLQIEADLHRGALE
jgi:soluble lytic murein transglycosylase